MPRRLATDILIVLLGAVALLMVAGLFSDIRRWHVNGWWDVLNDQVGYISVGRNLAETGELRSNLIYTATLAQKASQNYLYMPGHYVVLALAFKLAGAGPVQAVVPSLLAYCLSNVCVFLACRKLYGRTAAFWATGLFALFPANLAFSFTAMAEMPLIASVSVALCVFAHLPMWVRPIAGPVLLAIPFVFRETAALVVIPMAALTLGGVPLLRRIEWKPWLATGVLSLLSVALLAAIYKHPISSGRPQVIAANLFGGGEWDIYHDATVWERVPVNPGVRGWAKAVGANIARNIKRFPELLVTRPYGLEPATHLLLAIGIVLSLGIGFVRRDAMTMSCGVLGIAAVLLVFSCYNIAGYRGLRNLMFIWPALAIGLGGHLAEAAQRLFARRPLVAASGSIAAVCFGLACLAIHQIAGNDEFDAQMLTLAESTGHDPNRVLASTYDVGLHYALVHHPVQWAFVPVNAESLSVLRKRYDVGTLLVPQYGTSLSALRLRRLGYVMEQELNWRGRRISVYKMRPRPEDQSENAIGN